MARRLAAAISGARLKPHGSQAKPGEKREGPLRSQNTDYGSLGMSEV
jgi:hypothetical protein